MASKTLTLHAIIPCVPGKTDRVVELMRLMSVYIEANEPGTLQYEIMRVNKDRKTGREEVVMVERYADKQALQTHGSSERFQQHQKQMQDEGLVDGASKIMVLRPAGGFSRL